ncbi:tRNA uridine(34) 5-carboxymethylaminomethyl modification radical SAM/GNAT enzyme Elp3 [Candidatus Borrarchaeum sp.]|uniref:tRNA uridine(34) 5-carboxymethylaminomethyl modification radical SAM/GNAT enzyme Elp3 n=1 Tax=Candidatus Borrarchaeum sp. TaxID=2846742 RepID=UPI00257D76F3|nr:tRNA uridine(34) 5-carboxymethylaminomethyl modification radical SAM/GNAT enzyme Elp3 [Candidatus Borrarchaeum sp.]
MSSTLEERVCRGIIEDLLTTLSEVDAQLVQKLKKRHAKKYPSVGIVSNATILSHTTPEEKMLLLPILKTKSMRTISGVAVVAVMVKPYPCPNQSCIYCPTFSDIPKSYTGHEPSTMRGIQNDYDPYLQVKTRLNQLELIGHATDKILLSLKGGTVTYLPYEYQLSFVHRCLEALCDERYSDFEELKRAVETAQRKLVGVIVETRPDYSKISQTDEMLHLGVTTVELGVQTIFDEVFEICKRGHTVQDVIDATRILKDAGMKVAYHIMPGLPGSNEERDLIMFQEVFENPFYKPDNLKIYPCLVIKGTELYELWQSGNYKPYNAETMTNLLSHVLPNIPRWIRIQRIQRDISAKMIEDGVKKGNLRELAHEELSKSGITCSCIRCREQGIVYRKSGITPKIENLETLIETFNASEGIENFISYEDAVQKILLGFIRLRVPSEKAHRKEINDMRTTIVRELRVFGELVPIGEKPRHHQVQHRKIGELLLNEAELLSKDEYDSKKISVLSGLGVKPWFYKQGYTRDGVYVSKRL